MGVWVRNRATDGDSEQFREVGIDRRTSQIMTHEPLPDEIWTVARLLARGLTDQAVARREGIAVRTVHRRVATLMEALEASTRFETGYKLRDLEYLRAQGSSTSPSPAHGEGGEMASS